MCLVNKFPIMAGELYQCTARRLATSDPKTVNSGGTAGETYKWFQEKGYDYAPVLEGGTPVGYVGIAEVAEESESKLVKHVMSDIKLQNIISADAKFDDILTGLEEEFFYLLGGTNQVTGILTRADLNTSPARIHLFDRISFLERGLRELIDEVAPDWKKEVYLPEDQDKEINRLHDEAKDANVDLSKIHYAGFSTLKKVVEHYERCWQACGYGAEHKAGSDLAKIRNLRNDVAHSNLILQTTSADYNTQGRSIRDLIRIYEALTECNQSLQVRDE